MPLEYSLIPDSSVQKFILMRLDYLLDRLLAGLLVPIFVVFSVSELRAQSSESEERPNPSQASVFTGAFLPFGIIGVRDNYPLGGLRYSHPYDSVDLEYGIWGFNAKSVNMINAVVSVRLDLYLDDLLDVYFGVGPSVFYFERSPNVILPPGYEFAFGGHAMAGVFIKASDVLAIRSNFSYGINPGHNLTVDIGLVFNFGNADEEQDEE